MMDNQNKIDQIQSGCELSRNYMNLAELLLEDHMYVPAIIFGEMAIMSLLRAICLKQKGTLGSNYFDLDDLTELVGQNIGVKLDQVLFIYLITYITREDNISCLINIHREQAQKIILKVKDLLNELSLIIN
ncbi:hypothetical protein P4H42_17080 [Paenibacillus macerans]|uniref:hypothetical protein n=1 Tax=Paenibacillus macerans TaxID=44252 RepID=UPI002DBCC7D9|nr:hypothetical protein [Paenibacillus macerans]MEC0331327.1 hypothetical protein [Paenibacillus macerans]MED4954048.1 hypothetical protein [Paenibacillus macerans]